MNSTYAPPKQLEAWVSFLRAHAAITRQLNADLLDGLERCGFVEKASCSSDARVSYAKLTDAGHEKLREASSTHLAGVDELFLGRFSGAERASLAELFARLPMTGAACRGESCGAA